MGKIPGVARRVFWMYVDIFTREPKGEPPHVHIGRSPKHGKRSLKIYLNTFRIADGCTGRYTPGEIKDAVSLVRRINDLAMAQWIRLHGRPKKRG